MGRFLAGGMAAILLIASGLFWWQSGAERPAEVKAEAPPSLSPASPPSLPQGAAGAVGKPPPVSPEATPQSREQRRFARYDRDRDGIVTRVEMLSTRTAAFRKLDKDGNNLLSFEEWAIATSDKFAGADANRDNRLTPAEFATTAPKPRAKPRCDC